MASATCKYCKKVIYWAAQRLLGHLQGERGMAGDINGFDLYSAHGTDRARRHPGGAYPNIPTYRRHNCRKDSPQR